MRRARHHERGQAFVETMLFLPLLILAMMSIIFFSRLGVLSERAESAVRYGDLVSYRNGSAYSTSAIGYLLSQALYHNTPQQLLDLCLESPSNSSTPNPTDSGNVNSDILAALYQTQVVNSTATPAPSPQAFFRPDGVTQPNCAPGTVALSPQGATAAQTSSGQYPPGDLPLSTDSFSITAKVSVSSYFTPGIFGGTCTLTQGGGCQSTTANMDFVNVAAPTTLLTCIPGADIVLSVMNPAASGNTPPCD